MAVLFVPALAIGTLLGFLSFAVASLRTDIHSQTVGLLLLVPPAIFAVVLAGEIVGYTPVWDDFVLASGQAISLLAIGYLLRTEDVPTEREEVER